MNRKFAIVGWVTMVVFGAGLAYTGWRIVDSSREQMCAVCRRHVHAETRTVAEVGGARVVLCCPTCTEMLERSSGKQVRVVELTDHATGKALEPGRAWTVTGSEVNHCMRPEALITQDRQPAMMDFDRCAPSVIAFSNRAAAEAFSARHGGEVGRFQ